MNILKRAERKKVSLDKLEETFLPDEARINGELSFETIAERVIEEALAGGMQMRSYESKKEAAISAIAVSLAKKNNDPLYGLLKRHRDAWKHAKNEIITRYRGQAEMKFQSNQSKQF